MTRIRSILQKVKSPFQKLNLLLSIWALYEEIPNHDSSNIINQTSKSILFPLISQELLYTKLQGKFN